jgi:hypothetical protein
VNVGEKIPTASILRRGTLGNVSHALKTYQDRRLKLFCESCGEFLCLLISRRFVVVNFVYCRMDTAAPLMNMRAPYPKRYFVFGSAKLKEAAYLNVARIIKLPRILGIVNLRY